MKTNYHTHTMRCNHAVGDDRQYVESAIEKGMEELGFADHSPYIFSDGHQSGFRMGVNAYSEYVESILALKEDFMRQLPIDYLILGQHFVDSEPGKLYNGGASDDEERLVNYVDRVIKAMQLGVYSYVAHPDIINFTGSEEKYRSEIRRLCKASLESETPLEINLLGIREGRHYPKAAFWEEAGKLGCHVIFGCDSHSPKTVSDDASAAIAEEMVKKYGLVKEEYLRLKLK